MTTRLITAALAGATVAALAVLLLNTTTPTLPACPTEDSTNCLWDASTQGNHLGRSFIDWDGGVYYLDGAK